MPRSKKSRSFDKKPAGANTNSKVKAKTPRKVRGGGAGAAEQQAQVSDTQVRHALHTLVEDWAAQPHFDKLRQQCLESHKLRVSLKRLKRIFYDQREHPYVEGGESGSPQQSNSNNPEGGSSEVETSAGTSTPRKSGQTPVAVSAGGRRSSANGFPSLSASATASHAPQVSNAQRQQGGESMAHHIATTSATSTPARRSHGKPKAKSDDLSDVNHIVEEAHHLVETAAAGLSAALPSLDANERKQASEKSRQAQSKRTAPAPSPAKAHADATDEAAKHQRIEAAAAKAAAAVEAEAARLAHEAKAAAAAQQAAKAAAVSNKAKAGAKKAAARAANVAAVANTAKSNAKNVAAEAAKAAAITNTAKSNAKNVAAEAAKAAAITNTAKSNAKNVAAEAAKAAGITNTAKSNAKNVAAEAAKAAAITNTAKSNAKNVAAEAAKAAAITNTAKSNAKNVAAEAAKAAAITNTAKSNAKNVAAEAAKAAAITNTAKSNAKNVAAEAAKAAAITNTAKSNAKNVAAEAAKAAAITNTAKSNAKNVAAEAAKAAATTNTAKSNLRGAAQAAAAHAARRMSEPHVADPRDASERVMRAAFDAVDVDGEGTLSRLEMDMLLGRLGWRDEVSVDEAFAFLDTDSDTGRVSFEEFLRWHEFAWTHRVESGVETGVDDVPHHSRHSGDVASAARHHVRGDRHEVTTGQSTPVFHSDLNVVNEADTSEGGPLLDAARSRLDEVDISIMRRHFNEVDEDGDGELTAPEVERLLSRLGWTDTLTVADAFEFLDIDSDVDRVSFSEFLRWKEFAWKTRVEAGLEASHDGAPPAEVSVGLIRKQRSARDMLDVGNNLSPVAETDDEQDGDEQDGDEQDGDEQDGDEQDDEGADVDADADEEDTSARDTADRGAGAEPAREKRDLSDDQHSTPWLLIGGVVATAAIVAGILWTRRK